MSHSFPLAGRIGGALLASAVVAALFAAPMSASAAEPADTTLSFTPRLSGLTATVTGPYQMSAPTGSVEFTLDDVELGSAELTIVDGIHNQATAVLTGADPGTDGVLTATYIPDSPAYNGSSQSYVREMPEIHYSLDNFDNDAEIKPAVPNAAGWYNTLVRFYAHSNPGEGTARTVRRTPQRELWANTRPGFTVTSRLFFRDGGRAAVTVPMQVDNKNPTLAITGQGSGPFERTARPITCTATDKVSGVDGDCTVTYSKVVRGNGGNAIRRWTATATDIAGNTKTITRPMAVTGKAPQA